MKGTGNSSTFVPFPVTVIRLAVIIPALSRCVFSVLFFTFERIRIKKSWGYCDWLYQDPLTFALLAVLLLYSVILHEVAHGWVASLFGDDTARRSGRLTLAPLPHLSPPELRPLSRGI